VLSWALPGCIIPGSLPASIFGFGVILESLFDLDKENWIKLLP